VKAVRKSATSIKAARTRLINQQRKVRALNKIAKTPEALDWSARHCAKLQVAIDAATRALGKARP
jgi:hypothetical protein